MRLFSIAAVWLTFISVWGLSRSCVAQNQFDIVLEGPWIVYQDTSFSNKPVLVVVAPNVAGSNSDDTVWHDPQLSAGDGYYIVNRAIYCLTLAGICGDSEGTTLVTGNYPSTPRPLKVKFDQSAGATWDWTKVGSNGTVLILPMPTSYSENGVWGMRFGPAYSPTGKGYIKKDTTAHSIGLELHYSHSTAVPAFGLNSCTVQVMSGKNTVKCEHPASIGSHSQIANTGTLSLLMKAPFTNDGCDPHVRSVYPNMLALVGSSNNPDIKVIEPAVDTDPNGTPVFESDGQTDHYCLDKDPQKQLLEDQQEMVHMKQEIGKVTAIVERLRDLIGKISTLPKERSEGVPLKELSQAYDNLKDNPDFPRISELELISTLALGTKRRAKAIETELKTKLNTNLSEKTDLFEKLEKSADKAKTTIGLIITLEEIETAADELASSAPEKSAKDCRAPIMEATNQ